MKSDQMIRIAKEASPDLEIKKVETKSNGWDNDILMVNKEIVFRFPKSKEIAAKVMGEATLIRELLLRKTKLQIPDYEFLYENGAFAGVKYDYLPGEPLSETEHTFPMSSTNAALMGDFLTKLHGIDVSRFKGKTIKPIHTQKYWQDLYTSVETTLFPHLNQTQKNEVELFFEHFFNHPMFSDTYDTVIHGDLTTANILFRHEKGLISGIIDFTDAQLGDPAFDFAGLYWSFGPAFTKEVLSHYMMGDPDSIFNRVETFYGLQPIFHELLYTVKENHPVNWNLALKRFSYLFSLRD